jgi:glycosyltransferase involved in cell wall biosynthesis
MMHRPLRFCMITTFYPPYNFGGDGLFVQRLSNELAKRGHRVDVIHCIDSYRLLAGREPARGYDDHPNVTVHGLKSRFGFLSPLATQQLGVPVFKAASIRQILDQGFDVIHYHNISLVGGPKVLEYGQAIKLYTMHEYWLICPTHVLFRFNRAPCRQKHCFLCSLAYGRPPQWWRASRLLEAATKQVDTFIATSHFLEQKHREMGFRAPIVHLPYFIPALANETPSRQKSDDDWTPEAPYFLYVGRLEKLKGLQTIIPAFRECGSAQLFIAGSGRYEAHLRRLARDSGNIRFLGYVSGQQLDNLYRRAVAVLVPSVVYETFAQVIVEAFAQKTPVVVRNLGGMPELVRESGGGLIYDTEEALVAAMDHLLADRSRRDELGVRGFQAYQRNWTPEAYLERYMALIDELAAGRGEPLGQGSKRQLVP